MKIAGHSKVAYRKPTFNFFPICKLKIESKYNTYLYRGLPPGPINSPGKESIIAALYPSVNEYLYFVARGDGYHTFSTNEKDHNKAKKKFQEVRRRVKLQKNRKIERNYLEINSVFGSPLFHLNSSFSNFPLYKSDNVLAPSELITAILGIFLIHPHSYNSINAFPQLDVFPNAPPG